MTKNYIDKYQLNETRWKQIVFLNSVNIRHIYLMKIHVLYLCVIKLNIFF